jgi:D-serine deaminase-like pyridoxal phosphate-dependent protein
MTIFDAIQKPTLVLNRARAQKNIEKMAAKSARNEVRFRPHFKTHQSAHIGEWFRAAGVQAITVSSVDMALYFARHGWQDITIAFPVNVRQIEAINNLAGQVSLNLLVESPETVQFLADRLTSSVSVWIKVDAGYGRTGLNWADPAGLTVIAREVERSEQLALRGLLTHAGHTYHARGQTAVEAIYRETVSRLATACHGLALAGFGPLELSVGDTPACSLVDDFGDVDEIRPGNFVFFDLMQWQVGACREDEIAVATACPVVAKHPAQNRLVLYGGAVHHSKEFIVDEQGRQVFGYAALPAGDGWGPRMPGAYLSGLSQEHGLLHADTDTINRVNVGDLLLILPVHSCLTVNLLRKYLLLDGDVIKIEG